jgi:sugar/nucleoside kinase (ribokinase family)
LAVSVVVVGSVGIDTIETPHGRAADVLGGAATYAAVAAGYFAPVELVAVVGEDFPDRERAFLGARRIDLAGLETRPGPTFRWTGRYHEDMNVRDTLALELGVFGQFRPVLPEAYRRAEYVFLANIHPELQATVLDQLEGPRLIAADTMNHWIEGARADLARLLERVQLLVINDEEARLLSGERNVVRAARRILEMGPRSLIIKRGEYGAIHFAADTVFAVPAYPLEVVFDPTGAGDTFAGGLMGHLAASGDLSPAGIRKGIVYGSVLASYTVEDFSLERLRSVTREDIERRYRQFVSLTEF